MKRILIQIYLRTVLLFLCTYFSFFPAWAMAKPIHQGVSAPLSDALPVLLPGQTQTGWSTTTDQANHYLEVQQTESKVVISWQSYDIGADAHVHYEQGQNGIALNRIYNNDPSRIFGQLTATGSIYLVNQNGILFGENSRVNLNSLVASSLNIKDENFQNGLWKYQAENYMGSLGYQEPGDVENRGVIESNPGGRIFLLGSNVQNSGTISAEEGRVILAAGQEFDLEQKATTSGIKETLTADYTGEAVNTQSGQILADIGEVGIYGRIVRHDGLIRTVSTVKAGSSITLKASEKVSTGSNSSIDSQFRELGEEIVTTDPFPGRKINILAAEGHDILVDLSGDITFPSGILDINAGDGGRIYLSSGTSIDVSGSWVDKTAQDRVMSAQENTIELRDEFLQKNGILKGTTIYFLLNEGISIGNISEHLNSRSLSAAEMSTKGGTINLVAGSGDIIVMDKAVIDISGGGITYAGGYVQTTKLTSDGQVYDIADAPDYLTYDGLINYNDSYSEAHKTYSAAYTEGFDAGKLEMAAKKVAYEGELKASATQGLYQVNTADVVDDLGYKKSIGTLIPKGGTLIIGKAPIGERYQSVDQILDTIVVKTSIPGMDPGFDPETDLFPEDRGEETWLSDDLLGQSGLSNVTLSASKNIITEAGTSISLVPSRDPAGGLKVYARRIVHQGEVLVPGGNVVFHTVSNKTTDEYVFGSDPKVESLDYVSNEELGGPDGIVLTAGSSIRTAGEVIDNFSAYRTGSGFRSTGFLEGGNIEFLDKTLDGQGVVMEKGAALDVSGGYIMGTDRTLSDAGDAGAIKIQGPAIVLDGSLAGHSMMGQNGGSITLKALEIEVVTNGAPKLTEGYSSEKDLPDHMQGKLVMDDDRLDTTGFTSITLASLTDLTIHENVSLAPSAIKQTLSGRGQVQEQAVPLDYAGDTAISLVAGSSFSGDYNIDSDKVEYALLTIKPNASVSVAPGGDITLAGGKADISGVFTAPGGNIAVNTKSLLDTSSLLVRSDARFYAQGYVRESGRLSTGEILWEAKDGGNISFLSESALIMEEGCVVDVSGSETFLSYRRDKDKGFVSKISASEPGRISLSFRQGTDETGVSSLNAGYIGTKSLDSLKGASFSLASINIDSPLSLDDGILAGLAENGFDQLFLSSLSGIEFQGSQAIEMAEGISIDTPILIGTNEDVITLVSSYIKVANTYLPGEMVTSDASAALVIKANDIDIEGDVKIQGFSSASLTAQQDIRLSDKMINEKQYNEWDGGLTTDGDLTLTAARIYSTTGSQFTVTSSGKITILPSGVNRLDPIYSAYGKLTLIAENIEIKGVLAAPMGQIVLKADERVFLANGSVLTVAGETSVNYGRLDDESLEWYGYRYDENGKSMTANTLITGAPEKNIEITANEYIGESGAQINIEGGGSVYGYTFLSSSEGSLDPLSKLTNRYVILPNAMGDLPGKDAIYFEGNDLLPEGIYALLPESYAFIEGAVIVELQGNLNATTQVTASKEGYAMAVGYQADAGTGRHSSKAQVYTVRSASDVLSEGSYEFVGYTAGNGGSLSITANTNIFNNAVRASALSPDYRNGTLALSAKEVIVGSTPVYLGTGFNFDTVLADDQNLAGLADKLYLDAKKISDAGLWELNIGNEAVTQAIIFEENSVLTGQQINLAVAEDITLEKGAVIQATGDNASISILSTTGSLVMGEGSLIDSSYLISIDAMGLERGGDIHAGQVIKMASDNLIFADANPGNGLTLPDGLVIDEALWQSFSTLDQVWLNGRGMIGFAGDVDLAAKTAIVIDTPLLAGVTDESGKKASLDSDQVVMVNSGTKTDGKMAYARNTQLRVNADHITIGHGDVGLAGFSTVNLISQNNLTFRGAGSFTTNDAALSITSEMVTGTYWYDLGAGDDEYTYEVLDFKIDSGAGLLSMMDRSSAVAQANDNIGGRLSFVAGSIENSGTIDLSSGAILFSSADINMKAGSVVSVKGSKQDGTVYDAGSVDYESQGGTINLAYNALTDVSAGSAQGNAGTIGIRNPHGITVIEGNLAGTSRLGHGGTFILDMNSFGSTLATSETAVSSLMGKLSKGGFNNRIDIRARKGDVQLAKDVTAHEFRLSVDEGNVKTDAQINASGAEGGGRVEIYAGQNLTLSENTTILAKGTGTDADGGEVILGNGGNDGFMDLAGAVIDVSSVNGIGGNIYLRVPLNQGETEVNLNMNASLVGASDIVVEGVKTYKDTTISDTTISDTTAWKTNAHHLMNNYGDTITARLVAEAGGSLDGFSFIPGIEVQSIGNLSLNTDLDMTSWRFGTQKVAAALTLRAANDLNINKSIVDHPTNTGNLTSETAAASTNISLSAGASLASSDIFAVEQKKGNFKLKDEKMIYTEGGNINFASGNDTLIGKIYSKSTDYMTNNGMKYNLASYTGNIRGAASNDLLIDSGVIQTATGDITLDVVGDLTLNQRTNQDIGGSIRTTGQPGYFENAPYPKSAQQTWGYLYNSGGDILIRAGADVTRTLAGKVTTEHKSDAWDTRMMGFDFSDYPNSFEYFYTLCANYAGLNATQGIATMGGGDLTVLAGGNFFSAAGTFQEGDMTISVGGNLNGRFLTKSGEVELSTLGSFGTLSDDQVVEAYDSQISVTAQGNITLGTVLNPTITKNNFNSTFQWDLQYTEKTALSLAARRGNVELTGQSDSDFGFKATRSHVLPANLSINAGQDIMIGTDFYMTPSSTGFLELSAGRDITGKSSTGKDNFIYMSDLDPDEVYGNHNDPDGANVSLMGDLGNPNLHSAGVLHKDDYVLAVVEAGNDISNIGLAIPKAATIRAGQDIINLNYSGQNLRKTDETRIMAGRDIYYLVDREKNNTIGILAGGPGLTVVQAGNNIDLGRSDGIQSVGSLFNSYLPAGENDLMVIAGITQWYTADKIKTFFDQLRNAGTLYAKARADGDIELAEQILADVRNTRIDPFLAENEEIGGDINLVNSKVYTTGGTGDILALAAGEINVGLSGVTPPPITGKKSTDNGNSGFYTTSGGGLRLFAQRDINVNESRVMTFSGGDIDIWSDTGNINAGRGSKAAVASTSSYVVEDEKTGVLTVQYDPPAVGSGIRATASTVEEAGDINAFAPGGDIDAGEAGISGKNVTLSAKKVLNAQNIQTTGISIGFAKPAESSASIAGFSGGGGLADGGMLNEASSLLATVKERLNEAAPEGYSIEPKWVDVEVIEFDKDDEDKKNDNGKIEAS